MKTNEGKEFNLNNVVLYAKTKYDLILYVINKETKKGNFGMVWNTAENENKVLKGMKQIVCYKITDNGIEVTYSDGFIMTYSFDFYSDIERTSNAQKSLNEQPEETKTRR